VGVCATANDAAKANVAVVRVHLMVVSKNVGPKTPTASAPKGRRRLGAARRRRLRALAPVHAHQRPTAFELVAVQAKLQVPLAQALARIALGLPLAAVPYDHLAGAVLPRRNRALEAGVVQRVVFHMHRHALVGGVEARPLGHGPALQRAVELEAEVVVQAARMVLLHDEVQCAALLGGAPLRLGRGAEIAPFPIAVQRLSAHG